MSYTFYDLKRHGSTYLNCPISEVDVYPIVLNFTGEFNFNYSDVELFFITSISYLETLPIGSDPFTFRMFYSLNNESIEVYTLRTENVYDQQIISNIPLSVFADRFQGLGESCKVTLFGYTIHKLPNQLLMI